MTNAEDLIDPDDERNIPLEVDLDLNIAKKSGVEEARFAVNLYYTIQRLRIRALLRSYSLGKDGKPTHLMEHLMGRFAAQENHVKRILGAWAKDRELGRWSMQVMGIGPVIAAGLLAHIDIEKAPHVSSVWRFAGLDPTRSWISADAAGKMVAEVVGDGDITEDHMATLALRSGWKFDQLRKCATDDGEKAPTKKRLADAVCLRPWNAALKVVCWKMGESFKRVSGNPKSLYGRIYRERKALEVQRSESGQFADQAAAALKVKNYRRETTAKSAYTEGKLPPAHLDRRAARYATKVFLAHYWQKAWMLANPGKVPENPWVIDHGGHTDVIPPEVPFDA